MGSSRIHRVRSRSAEDRLMISSRSVSDELTGIWRKEKCAVSIPPSQACAQLHCWSFFETKRWAGGTTENSSSGSTGSCAGGPRYAQTKSPHSRVGYQEAGTRSRNVLSGGIVGISTQRPATSNFQPWYTQRRP